ncbi:GNAT family N-acetyltransferase [Paucibacter sp. DJ1R-11]|uniref:GNAT family N-acetyltransferase n=1 Tax=Paucibacter sp. DJ1R-11 TaxID=2893556 RepID=UPI0021E37AC0|nr:GNAT family N-acetyltransferase [Paucibacter sp. DJ1R-11]MCV2362644.1 GNAT family N-acetyltransferase [Paucibacter sp. DJ1R-11]
MPTETDLLIRLDDLSDPRIAAFMEEHLQDMRATSPPESVHALDMNKLRQPDIAFWTAWLSDERGAPGQMLAATAAIKHLDAAHAELKSMRTAAVLRGRGLARRMLRHVLSEARQRGYRRLSLETGTQDFFEPARQLYASEGFVDCAPFGGYRLDPYSCFMTLELK